MSLPNVTIINVTINYTIPNSLIVDMLDTAGMAIGYWARAATINESEGTYFVIEAESHNDKPVQGKAVYFRTLADQLVRMGSGLYSDQFNDRIVTACRTTLQEVANGDEYPGGDLDADVVDVLVQLAMFGEVIYG